MNVLPAGFTPPSGVRRTITDECFGMWASSSVYSTNHDTQFIRNIKMRLTPKKYYQNLCRKIQGIYRIWVHIINQIDL